VIVVVVDTLRADRLGAYGSTRPTSPALDAWAEEALVFDHAFATSSWTLPSFASILTGHLPSRHGAGALAPTGPGDAKSRSSAKRPTAAGGGRSFTVLDPSLETLPEILSRQGYATAAIVNNSFLHPDFGLARGFRDYDHLPATNTTLRRADVVVDRSLAWLDAHSAQPFFLLVHFFDPHMDYDPPPDARGRFTAAIDSNRSLPVQEVFKLQRVVPNLSNEDRAFIDAAYDEEILGVDAPIDRLLEGLRKRELLERVLLVVTSDHGEELFEHGGFEHGHTMYGELLHVPLILSGPGIRRGREKAPVSLLDLAPTVLEAAGLEAPAGMAGISLPGVAGGANAAPRSETRVLVAEGNLYGPQLLAAIQWPWKVISNPSTGEVLLFDLSRDPKEEKDLSEAEPERARSVLAQAAARIAAAASTATTPRTVRLDPATEERLRSLGYTD
jgi:arylsulfatase A-like enzyme